MAAADFCDWRDEVAEEARRVNEERAAEIAAIDSAADAGVRDAAQSVLNTLGRIRLEETRDQELRFSAIVDGKQGDVFVHYPHGARFEAAGLTIREGVLREIGVDLPRDPGMSAATERRRSRVAEELGRFGITVTGTTRFKS